MGSGFAPSSSQLPSEKSGQSVGILGNLTESELGPTYSLEVMPNSIEILGPPVYNILEGEELALICKGGGGAGNTVWRRKDGLMPNGQPYILGGQVILERVGRKNRGEYQCWDNSSTTTTHNYRGKVVNVQCK